MKSRPNSVAFCGGAFGDEGKGRIVDEYVAALAKKGPVVVYRDNGGANAGHTMTLASGQVVALHQLPSGIFCDQATVVLGKGMVIHPGDFITELSEVEHLIGSLEVEQKTKRPSAPRSGAAMAAKKTAVLDAVHFGLAKILVDEMAVLSLDTHRAFESALKSWQSGGKGSTGRGISPAYSDVLLRHPLRVRDIVAFDAKKVEQHYKLYEALLKGLGAKLAEAKVSLLEKSGVVTGATAPVAAKTEVDRNANGVGKTTSAKNSVESGFGKVGSLLEFSARLKQQGKLLARYSSEVTTFLAKSWSDQRCSFVFEKAQGIGLDYRWGVYPDVTASATTFDGIWSASEGVINPEEIKVRAAVIKATYMSSVGSRILPTKMDESLAARIREDAHEYGATTRRPRDIAYLDLPALRFYTKVGEVNCHVLTHMDIVYPKVPIKVCVGYELNGKKVEYRPDQEYLLKVKPIYREFASWDQATIQAAKTFADIPVSAQKFLQFIARELKTKIILITTGPKRHQSVKMSVV